MISRSRTTIQQQPYLQYYKNKLTLSLLYTYQNIYLSLERNCPYFYSTWMPLYRIVLLVAFRKEIPAFYISFKRYIHATLSKKKAILIKLFHNYHSQCARCVTVCATFHIKQRTASP